ncbi:hypothetical protein ANACOL_00871 [Anaerotruncus colihominis DSM 17241]|uniref:Uncharacterized protein n=1 Tax=Anaerotruncus colihominis DSM 17241 TaxID=445972 RepID=B0P7Y2_9FIRM|nr:hypothetical protein ANACOL_00871 [Anaerotruncus colihominis DSM 17241]
MEKAFFREKIPLEGRHSVFKQSAPAGKPTASLYHKSNHLARRGRRFAK